MIAPRRGYRGDGESWTNWWVLPASPATDEEILDDLDACEHYGGPGQTFTRAPFVARRTATRVLVLQSGGLDV